MASQATPQTALVVGPVAPVSRWCRLRFDTDWLDWQNKHTYLLASGDGGIVPAADTITDAAGACP